MGLAAGDALGTTLEFKSPGTFRPISDIVGGGPFGLRSGEWTDDTSMALCMAESLIEKRDFDPADQLRRYVRWYREGHMSATGTCFDIGGATSEALHRFEQTSEPYSGSRDPNRAGNGSLMRLAPVPLFYARTPLPEHQGRKAIDAIERSGESSRTTHGAQTAVDACRYMGALIAGAIQGVDKGTLLSERYSPVGSGYWEESPLSAEIDEVAAGSFKRKEPPQIRGRGYVVAALEAALWAFHKSDSFKEGALLAVNLGEDADTTGAIYGQLAGAFYGEKGIPQPWRYRLAHRLLIEYFAERLFCLANTGEDSQRKGLRRIEEAFAERFSTWGITLPPEDVRERRRGKIVAAGWAIWYLFGSDERGEYLDYYASHRMMGGDEHTRIREDGRREGLPSISSMRLGSADSEEDARLEAEHKQETHRVAKMLEEKGFGIEGNEPGGVQINRFLALGSEDSPVQRYSHEPSWSTVSNHEQIIFCRDLTDDPEEARRTKAYFPTVFDESEEVIVQYDLFMHEAEVFIYPLANAVQEGAITADEARNRFEPYREHMPELYDTDEWEEYENGFPDVDHFMDWGAGPGIADFWENAAELGGEGVYFNEGEHPGGSPVFYIYRKEALGELQEALSGRYKIVVRDQREYDMSLSSDPEEARRIIEQARNEPEGEPV